MNAQSEAWEHVVSESAHWERYLAGESRGSGRVPPQIDLAVVMEVLTTIQARMDGVEARLEKQDNDPPLLTSVVSAPTAPQVPSQSPQPREGPVPDMKIMKFLKLKPPTFVGKDHTDDPQGFLDDYEKICSVVECSDSQKVKLVAYQLRGRADHWWQTWSRGRASNASPVRWSEFKRTFRDQFILRSISDAWAKEFKTLRKGSQTVDEYNAAFVRLAEFAPHMVPFILL